MFRILCICSGNTCRSPMAQALLQLKVQKYGWPVAVKSAGLAACPGDPASENAVRAIAEIGGDLCGHRSLALTTDSLFEADAVFCMNRTQKAVLSRYIDPKKVFVPTPEIPDPFGGDLDCYRACRDALDAATDAFLAACAVPRIDAMGEADAAAIAEIERACFSTPWSEDALREELFNENARFFVLKVLGEAVGYVGMHLICGEGYLTNVAVLPRARRKGFARLLMEHAIAVCKDEGALFLSLEVRESNLPAQRLYQSLGFTVRGERKNFYAQPQENARIMTLDFEQ